MWIICFGVGISVNEVFFSNHTLGVITWRWSYVTNVITKLWPCSKQSPNLPLTSQVIMTEQKLYRTECKYDPTECELFMLKGLENVKWDNFALINGI